MRSTSPSLYRVSIHAVIRSNTKQFLLVKRKSNKWDFPGGGLIHGETPMKCLRREVIEELGVQSEIIDQNPIILLINGVTDKKGNTFYELSLFYRVKLLSDRIKLNSKNIDYKYSSLHELMNLRIHEKRKGLINKLQTLYS